MKKNIIFYVLLTTIGFCSASEHEIEDPLEDALLQALLDQQVTLDQQALLDEQALLQLQTDLGLNLPPQLQQPVIVTQPALQQPKQSVTNKNICPYCNKPFEASADLTRHILTHTGEKPWDCQICGKKFNQQNHLKTHHEKLHSKITDFVCTKGCPKTFFPTQATLTRHYTEDHGIVVRKEDHRIVVRKYVCTVNNCGKTYSQSSHLKKHIQAGKHNPCSFEGCNAICKSEAELAQHIKTHSQKNKAETEMDSNEEDTIDSNDEAGPADEKPTFECTICGKFFAKECNVTRHMKNIHKKIHHK